MRPWRLCRDRRARQRSALVRAHRHREPRRLSRCYRRREGCCSLTPRPRVRSARVGGGERREPWQMRLRVKGERKRWRGGWVGSGEEGIRCRRRRRTLELQHAVIAKALFRLLARDGRLLARLCDDRCCDARRLAAHVAVLHLLERLERRRDAGADTLEHDIEKRVELLDCRRGALLIRKLEQ